MEQSSIDRSIGVIGGGQLGRMMAEAAAPLGVTLHVLDPADPAPAGTPAASHTVATFDDETAITALAERVDVLTYEIELADPDVLSSVAEATDTPVHPTPSTLRTIQDKAVQKELFVEADIPVPRFRTVDTRSELVDACEELGFPAMLKARTGGYDGRGNVPLSGPDDVDAALAAIEGPAMLEEFVDFVRELSVIGVRGPDGIETYTPAENVHEAEILRETIVPARTSSTVAERARMVARDVMNRLDGRGVYGIELFETADEQVLVNEVSPRPHNSGHWTIEGAVHSQFEQHVRAVLGLPLGSCRRRSSIVTANLLGDVARPTPAAPVGIEQLLRAPDVHLHWYGKREVRPLRKMGHIAVVARSEDDLEPLLGRARKYEAGVTFSD